MIRKYRAFPPIPILAATVLLLSAIPAPAGHPCGCGRRCGWGCGYGCGFGVGVGFFYNGVGGYAYGLPLAPYVGYDLDDDHHGYYGGTRYRDFYSYGRSDGFGYYPGPEWFAYPRPGTCHDDCPGPQGLFVPGGPYSLSAYLAHTGMAHPPMPPPEVEAGKAQPVLASRTQPRAETPAHFEVQVPPGAEVWIGDTKTSQTAAKREFVSPVLMPGKEYVYEIRARWTADERMVEQTQKLTIHAGDRLHVRFPLPAAEARLQLAH